ncbi:MAG: hypothetical protein ACK4ZJ_18665, partial [Allorhizobium sp.]
MDTIPLLRSRSWQPGGPARRPDLPEASPRDVFLLAVACGQSMRAARTRSSVLARPGAFAQQLSELDRSADPAGVGPALLR